MTRIDADVDADVGAGRRHTFVRLSVASGQTFAVKFKWIRVDGHQSDAIDQKNGGRMASICMKSSGGNGDLWSGVSLNNSLAMNELDRMALNAPTFLYGGR